MIDLVYLLLVNAVIALLIGVVWLRVDHKKGFKNHIAAVRAELEHVRKRMTVCEQQQEHFMKTGRQMSKDIHGRLTDHIRSDHSKDSGGAQ